ncbi:tRNA-uridine aminocarboxypropyltransferase [Alteromonas sp. D210916BOD_24]|uniref:tRNA-uridine aminocarboxypropyltransferase n=1 Tax=Alteromonas sp. D210916BOD_24 TaxID=3157618 RepID=UPI00399C6E39
MRKHCKHCQYPLSTCICSYICPVELDFEIKIVQHPKEATHAKNTARLAALSIPTARIINSADGAAMDTLANSCDHRSTLLVYPSEYSTPIETLADTTKQAVTTLVLIDGSWKQAFGIVKQHPWLQSLTSVHFTQAPHSNYLIRHTSLPHALSTLEATAYSASCISKLDISSLYRLQRAMQDNWQGPLTHRRKV